MDPGSFVQKSAVAAGRVTGSSGATPLKAGDVAVARTGTGVYTLTAGITIPLGGCVVDLTLQGNSGVISYVITSATVITVSTFAVDGTTATDKDFSFSIDYLPPGQ